MTMRVALGALVESCTDVPTASRRTAVLVGPFELQSVVLYVPTQIDP
jgi:hypothetical protein